MENTHIFRHVGSDRYIIIQTNDAPMGGNIIGVNFEQGLEGGITFVDSDPHLTKYVLGRLVEDDYSTYVINPEFDQWLDSIDKYIWEWWNKQNEPSLNEIPVPILNDVFSEIEESIISIEEHISDMGEDDLEKLSNLKRFVALMTDNHGVYVSKTKTEFVNNLK